MSMEISPAFVKEILFQRNVRLLYHANQENPELTDWESVPDASARISIGMLEEMLNDITFPMYYPSTQSIEDCAPMLPPYR